LARFVDVSWPPQCCRRRSIFSTKDRRFPRNMLGEVFCKKSGAMPVIPPAPASHPTMILRNFPLVIGAAGRGWEKQKPEKRTKGRIRSNLFHHGAPSSFNSMVSFSLLRGVDDVLPEGQSARLPGHSCLTLTTFRSFCKIFFRLALKGCRH